MQLCIFYAELMRACGIEDIRATVFGFDEAGLIIGLGLFPGTVRSEIQTIESEAGSSSP
jgi:hypothetical protein